MRIARDKLLDVAEVVVVVVAEVVVVEVVVVIVVTLISGSPVVVKSVFAVDVPRTCIKQ